MEGFSSRVSSQVTVLEPLTTELATSRPTHDLLTVGEDLDHGFLATLLQLLTQGDRVGQVVATPGQLGVEQGVLTTEADRRVIREALQGMIAVTDNPM